MKVPYSMQMPPGLPARVVIVCTLLFGVAIARAERRQVAVVDLSGELATATLAAELHRVLLGHPDLQPIQDPGIPAQLYGSFPRGDGRALEDAVVSKETAEGSLAKYRFELAQQSASNGQEFLRSAAPSTPVTRAYAQLSFIRGQALLGLPKQASEAPQEFALAHRLDPSFVPDAARYLPDVVQAFDAAKQRWTGKATLSIVGHGRISIDGQDSGAAPADVEVEAGPHIVWLTGEDRVTLAKQVLVEVGKKTKVEIENKPATQEIKIARVRMKLRSADATSRAAAISALAGLVKVRDAVLLNSVNNRIIWQTWNDGSRVDVRPLAFRS
jgi:hypothetical protein